MALHSESPMLTNLLNIVLCSCASGHINYWLEGFAYVLSMSSAIAETLSEFCIRESWILSFESLLTVFTMCIILRQRAYYLSKRSLWTLTPYYCAIPLV